MAKKTKPRSRAPGGHAVAEERPRRAWGAGVAAALRPAKKALRPPSKMSLSTWADEYFYLSAESAAEPGRWRTLAYQRGVMDAITDPRVKRVSMKKSARIGYTKMVNATIGYYVHQDPCPIMVVQPTVDDAEGYSKEEIAPMVRDCAVLTDLIGTAPPRRGRPKKGAKDKGRESSAKTSSETILLKKFPGGVLEVVGANSGRGFRRRSRRVVIFDEVDGYPASAGNEGDPVKLGERRAEYYWNRKIVAGSTPLIAGASRIEELYEAGDRRRYYVPCPHCGHMDYLRFSAEYGEGQGGHIMDWGSDPDTAHFICSGCGKDIEESSKRAMIAAGEWRAEGEFTGHASFSIWAAYSLSPNATWAQLAQEYLEAKGDPLKLKTFVNTALGESYQETGEAPEWEKLFNRRESYAIGTVPDGVVVITAGVDVQKDRFYYEVVGWGAGKESWSIAAGEIDGDTALESTWAKLDDELLAQAFVGSDGGVHTISMLAVDSGYNTQMAYSWARGKPRVMTTKGVAGRKELLGSATKVDVKVNGKKKARGHRLWPVGVDTAKAELYGWLGLEVAEDGSVPAGYCHFPGGHPEWFYKQLTAEHMVTITSRRTRRQKREWHVLPNRENHILDCRIYARAAAARIGIDRLARDAVARASASAKTATPAEPATATASAQPPAPPSPPAQPPQPPLETGRSAGFLGRPRGWLRPRR